MKQKYRTWILGILIIGIFGMPWMVSSAAKSFELVVKDLKGPDGKLEYDLWKVSDKTYHTDEQLVHRHRSCQRMDKNELEEKYGNFIEGRRDLEKGWVFELEETGLYYGRQKDDVENPVDFLAIVKDEEKLVVRPKASTTKVILKKYLNEVSNENLLPGMKFELYDEKGNLQYFREGRWVRPGTVTGETVLVTDGQGKITLIGLPPGRYEFREIPQVGYKLKTGKKEMSFVLSDGSNEQVVHIAVINEGDNPRGGRKFIKINEEQEGLEGAVFKLYRKDDKGKLTPVLQKDGTEYIIRSDENGLFEIDNLLYGDYVLVETKAPVADKVMYTPLKEEIAFTIDGESSGLPPIIIVNKKSPDKPGEPDEPGEPEEPGKTDEPSKPGDGPKVNPPNRPSSPPKINIPKTGDIQIFLFTIGGICLILLGKMVYGNRRQEKNK